MSKTANTVIALGSNLGDRTKNLDTASLLLGEFGQVKEVSKKYNNKAYGFENQPDFLNSAVFFNTKLSPEELLVACKSIEEKMGRVKTFRNGPRLIDVDIIFYDNITLKTPTLQIPHCDWQNRDFVISPLLDLLEKNCLKTFNDLEKILNLKTRNLEAQI